MQQPYRRPDLDPIDLNRPVYENSSIYAYATQTPLVLPMSNSEESPDKRHFHRTPLSTRSRPPRYYKNSSKLRIARLIPSLSLLLEGSVSEDDDSLPPGMVVPKTSIYWTILISLTTIFFIYFTLINISINQTDRKGRSYAPGVKKIVAYSLLKQIEIGSEIYECDESNYNIAGGRVVGKDRRGVGWEEEGSWTKIGGKLFVASVHLDRRLDPFHYVRIIGMVEGTWKQNFYCQFSTFNSTYRSSKATITPIWSEFWNRHDTNIYFNPVLLSCRVPAGVVPTSVSLGTTACRRPSERDSFRLKTGNRSKNTFTVCVKPLDFAEDISGRLIQWIEIGRVLGAERIEVYVEKVQRNVWRILKWYNVTYPGEVVIRRFRRISEKPNSEEDILRKLWQKRRYEVLAYNSCFYRNIENSQFVVPLDIDEIIVPRVLFTWQKLLADIFASLPDPEESFASFMVPNAYYFGKLNGQYNDIFFLRNLRRTNFSPAGDSGKSFISTKNALTVFNHYALEVLRPGISGTYFIPSTFAQLNHYKETCNAVIFAECEKYFSSPRITDSIILKYEKLFLLKYNDSVAKMQSSGIL